MSETTTAGGKLTHEISLLATACGLIAAVGYMMANICLRAVSHLDPSWVTCIKALPCVIVCGPILLRRSFNRQILFFSAGDLFRTLAVALFCQIFGNVFFQWSLGVVGIALTVPLTLGAMIASGVLMGHWLLRDTITLRMAIASGVLVIAIFVLSFGAAAANESLVQSQVEGSSSQSWAIAGVAAACAAGVAFSTLNVSIRFSANRGTPQSSILFSVGLVGVIVLGTVAYWRNDGLPIATTRREDWLPLIGAGICNLIAFWALTKALHISSVVFVNALNASQTAMAAIAGVLIFEEPLTMAMVIGCLLTALGLLQMKRRKNHATRPSSRGQRRSQTQQPQESHA